MKKTNIFNNVNFVNILTVTLDATSNFDEKGKPETFTNVKAVKYELAGKVTFFCVLTLFDQ